jgi:hypothetical protein
MLYKPLLYLHNINKIDLLLTKVKPYHVDSEGLQMPLNLVYSLKKKASKWNRSK